MVHTAIKIRVDLKKTPGHTDLWQGKDQEHVERIIPESLFLFWSLLFGGIDILEGSMKTHWKTVMLRGLSAALPKT